MKSSFVAALLILLLSLQSVAAKDKPAPAVNAGDKASFETVSTWVRAQMDEGGRYAETSAGERAQVSKQLDEMGVLFDSKDSVEQMDGDEKMKLFNCQEEINAILGKRDGERLICKSERPIGSNIPVRVCQTAREIDQRRQEDRNNLRRKQDVNTQEKWG